MNQLKHTVHTSDEQRQKQIRVSATPHTHTTVVSILVSISPLDASYVSFKLIHFWLNTITWPQNKNYSFIWYSYKNDNIEFGTSYKECIVIEYMLTILYLLYEYIIVSCSYSSSSCTIVCKFRLHGHIHVNIRSIISVIL